MNDCARAPNTAVAAHLAEVGLGLARELGHDLGAVEQEEVRARLGGEGLGDHGLPRARRAVHEHAARGRDAHGAEDGWVAQGQLDELADGGQLARAAADVVVADVVQPAVVLALEGLARVDDRLVVDDAVVGLVSLLAEVHGRHLELDAAHGAAGLEHVAVLERDALALEVRHHKHLEEVARHADDGVREGLHHDRLGELGRVVGRNSDDVSEANAQVRPQYLGDGDLVVRHLVVHIHDRQSVFSPLPFQLHGVAGI